MRKIYSLVLIAAALLLGTNAWADPTEIVVKDFNALKTALSTSGTADVVKLGQDIAYPSNGGSDLLDIQRSLTLDGQGYKISGYAVRGNHTGQGNNGQYQKITLVINHQATHSGLTVTLTNLTVDFGYNQSQGVAVFAYDGVDELNMDHCTIVNTASQSIPVALFGNTQNRIELNIDDSYINAGLGETSLGEYAKGYPIVVFKPADVNITNSTLKGYCAMSFKCPLDLIPGNRWQNGLGNNPNGGARGTVVTADNTYFNAVNSSNGVSNGFGVFNLEDDGITINLNNCSMNATALGDASQAFLLLNGWYVPQTRHSESIHVKISGDNSHINGDIVNNFWHTYYSDITGSKHTLENGAEVGNENYKCTGNNTVSAWAYASDIKVTIEGGTYAINPYTYQYRTHLKTEGLPAIAKNVNYDNDNYFNFANLYIDDSKYEVKTVKQGSQTLYRVVAKSTGTAINDNAGQNETKTVEVATGTPVTLDQKTTETGYLEVKDNGSSQATTVTVAKNDADPTQSQTLVVNNGLDVQGSSSVVVEPTASLVVGEGGITTQSATNIVLKADEDGGASLLLHPDITVNQTPALTVKMNAKNVGLKGGEYYWHRFAMPVASISSLPRNPNRATAIYGWNYENQEWYALSGLSELVPFAGYTLTVDNTSDPDLIDVEYTFEGNLTGNIDKVLDFSHQGYNFFGNSYTGYIKVSLLATEILGNADIDGSIWMWNPETQGYAAVPLQGLKDAENTLPEQALNMMYPKWQREIAPMQTFIFRLPNTTSAKATVDYAATIWSNPRYGNPSLAPARVNSNIEGTIVRLSVVDANGNSDEMLFMAKDAYSDAYDRGYDATKYMNSNSINMYTMQNGEKLSSVATDNLNGKAFDIDTKDAISYTMTINAVLGDAEYAIKDIVTNSIVTLTQGNTYTFTAQPNSTVAGRFVFVPVQKMPTDVETVEATSNVRGIYTITGQYVGEDFETLPAGVYVVDGVKIVK